VKYTNKASNKRVSEWLIGANASEGVSKGVSERGSDAERDQYVQALIREVSE
jgi:hypothetical protein